MVRLGRYIDFMYYHVWRVLKRLQVPLPHEAGFSPYDNPYSDKGFFKINDYEVPHNPMKKIQKISTDKNLFGTHQHGAWSDYINQD